MRSSFNSLAELDAVEHGPQAPGAGRDLVGGRLELVGDDDEGAAAAAEMARLETRIHADQRDVDRGFRQSRNGLAEFRQRILDDRERLVD